MKRSSRRFLVAAVAIALGSSLLSLPYLTPAFSSESSASQVLTVAPVPVDSASWQGVLMAGRW
ncbi:MAG: hypothetical protein ACREXV_06900 [Polaromonas sp.]